VTVAICDEILFSFSGQLNGSKVEYLASNRVLTARIGHTKPFPLAGWNETVNPILAVQYALTQSPKLGILCRRGKRDRESFSIYSMRAKEKGHLLSDPHLIHLNNT